MRKLGGVMLKRRKDQPMHRSPSGQWAGIDGPNAPRSEHASSNMHSASCFEKFYIIKERWRTQKTEP